MTGLTGGARVAEATNEPMATTFMRQTLAIMANPAVRGANAAETAVLVLSPDLSRLIWANAAAAQGFGLSLPGPQEGADDRPKILDQLSGSAGVLARKGRTSLLLRANRGARALSIPAELRLLSVDGGGVSEDYALLTARAGRSAYRPQDRDGALIREAGLAEDRSARLVPMDAVTSLAPTDDLPAAQAIAAFVASGEDIADIATTSGASLLLARIADDRMFAAPGEDGAQAASEPELSPSSPAPSATQSPPQAEQASRRFRSNWASVSPTTTPAPVSDPQSPDDSDRPAGGDGSAEGGFDEVTSAKAATEHSAGGEQAVDVSTVAGEDSPEDVAPGAAETPAKPDADSRPVRWHSVWTVAAPPSGETALEPDPAAAPEPGAPDAGRADRPAPEEPDAGPLPDWVASGDPRQSVAEDEPSSPDGTPSRSEDDVSGVAPESRGPDAGDAPSPDAPPPETEPSLEDQAATLPSEHPSPPLAGPSADDDATAAADESEAAAASIDAPDTRPARASDFTPPLAGAQTPAPGAFHARTSGDPVRFVWRVDSDGRFRSLSPEFADAVGPASAAVLDRSVEEVARAYRLDEDGALRRLLSRRDTWSGRTVMWPLEGTAKKVPVDLAALPIYARDRSFDGFRGFGVVRLADAVDDTDAIGLRPAAALRDVPPADPSADDSADSALEESLPAFMRSIGAATPPINFGRRDPDSRPAAPAQAADRPARSDAPEERPGDKIIRLEERRRASNAGLSQSEEAAFRAIGETLAQEGAQPRDLAEAVTAASKRIGAIEEARQADTGSADPADMSIDQSGAGTTDPDFAAALDSAYGTLPMPILVQTGQELVYANREFLDLAGHADLAALKSAGGFDSLIVDRQEGDADFLRLRRTNGQTMAIRARMQRTSVDGTSCLLFAFFATPRLSLVARETFEAADMPAPGVTRGVLEDPLLGLAADGIVLVEEDGLVTAMSGPAQRLFDISPTDVSGRPFVTLFAHESQKAIKDLMSGEEDGDNNPAEHGAKWFARRDVIGRVARGEFLPLSVSLGRVPGTSGFCAVINDITPWKRAEETALRERASAEASNLQKSTFLGEVAQEIKDPIDAMIGFADLIGTESLGPVGNERYLEYLDDIKRSGHQVIDLVTILHDLAQVESGRQELSFEAVSLAEIVTEVTSVMSPQANRQRVIMRTHLPSSVPPVVGDRHTIRQIATNLVANSIRSTPTGGQLIVSLRYEAETGVSLRFRDSGVGMRQDEIDSALRGPGTGYASSGAETGRLGLPLTKALAEANRAELSIASTPGEGTLVEVRFPPTRVLLD